MQGQAALQQAGTSEKMANMSIQDMQTLLNAYNQYAAPQQAGAAQAISGLQAPGQQTGQLASNYINQLGSPSTAGGVNSPQLLQQLEQFLGNPQATAAQQQFGTTNANLNNTGGTNLAQQAPGLQSFYQNEMQNGINPQYAQNAQNQLTQQFQTSQNNILANARPGQNTTALEQQAQNNLLTQGANLGGQLAGESQQISQQGAQGAQQLASAQDQQKMQMLQQALQNAGASTEQINQFLTQAFQTGNQYQQQQIGNAGQAAQAGTSALDTIMNFINQKANFLPGVGSNAANLSENLGYQSQQGLANLSNNLANNNPFATLFGGGGSTNNTSSTGGGDSSSYTNPSVSPTAPITPGGMLSTPY